MLRQLILELGAAYDALFPLIEGVEDILRLNVSEETRREAEVLLAELRERQALLYAAITALSALEADGYPVLPTASANDAILSDISAQITSISAAESLFTPQAASLTFTVSPAVLKETENA